MNAKELIKNYDLIGRLKCKLPMSIWEKTYKLVELDKEWCERIVSHGISPEDVGNENGYFLLHDVMHDVKGILQEDEHFLPRL